MLALALLNLILTVIVEWAVVCLCLRRCEMPDAVTVLQVNLLTNPLAHLAILGLGLGFGTVEVLVLLSEVGLFRLLLARTWPQAWILASVANGATALLSFAQIGSHLLGPVH